MWWNIWTVAIWCFTFKWRDALRNIKRNSLAPKSYRDWNFYIRKESFIGMYCSVIKTEKIHKRKKPYSTTNRNRKKPYTQTNNITSNTITTMDCMSPVCRIVFDQTRLIKPNRWMHNIHVKKRQNEAKQRAHLQITQVK